MKFEEFEPKTNNRFLVTFLNIDIPPFVVFKVRRPRLCEGKWTPMSFEMWDPIEKSTTRALYDRPELIDLTLSLLTPVGEITEEWRIKGKISEINWGVLDWSNGDPVEIQVMMDIVECDLINDISK